MNLATNLSFYFHVFFKRNRKKLQNPASSFTQAVFLPAVSLSVLFRATEKQWPSPGLELSLSCRDYQVCHWLFQSLSSLFSDGSCLWCHYSYAGNPNSTALCLPLRLDISNKEFDFCASNAGSTARAKQSIWDWSLGLNCLLLILVFLPRKARCLCLRCDAFQKLLMPICSVLRVNDAVVKCCTSRHESTDENELKWSCMLELASASLFKPSCLIS